MKPGRWGQIERIYRAALECEGSDRSALLTDACGGDAELRRGVELLLGYRADSEVLPATLDETARPLRPLNSEVSASSLNPGDLLGRYRIDALLGSGGMGSVYRAYDSTLKRPLAIKILQEQDARSQTRLLREARSASALNHPNICTIYEVGVETGRGFIAMEYVDGRALSELVDGTALPIEDSVRYGIEVADALAHAHDRGIVHGDLKAANAIVSSSGRVKIVDFGLARNYATTSGGSTLESPTLSGVVAGTPYAMAPEQLRGVRADARSDIWALGVLLCEMVAGTKPFNGSTLAELFSSIFRDPPAPLPLQTPDSLRQIVQKCLTKDPAQRYQRAADVRLVLEAASSRHQGPNVAPGAPLPPPPQFATAAGAVRFVGRESELRQMAQIWEQAKGGRRQVVLLSGEPGIGKTRLSIEFAQQCSSEGATVLVGRSDEEALVPYQPFVEALNWYAHVCPEANLRAQLAAIGGGAELAQLIPELLRRFRDLPAPPAMNPEGQRYRLFEAIAALLSAASEARPLLVVFDDLHWADKPTLLMLKHIVRSSGLASLCIIGTYRESELGRTHPLAEMLADLRREHAVTRLSLRGLDDGQVRMLVDTFAGPEVPPQLASLVADSTGGNPFFVAEMLRHLAETGALARLVGDLGLPEGVKEVIGRRLSRLSEACNHTLSLAAIVGREFDLAVLEALGDLPEDRLLDVIDEAVRAQLIAEVPGTPERFSFMHALIRETLYGELTSSRRLRLHRRVGEAIERVAQGRPTPPLADLAYHFAQAAPAGVVDKAIDYATRAGDRVADALAHEEAARFYEMALQALEFKPSGPETQARRVDLHTRRAYAFGAVGQWVLEKVEVEQALEHLDQHQVERRCELVLRLADASFYLLDIPAVERFATEALELAEQVHRSDVAADAIAWFARCRQAKGDLAGAIAMDRLALERPGGRVVHFHGGLSLYLAGRTAEAVTRAAHGAEIARSSRDASFIMYSLPHLGLSLGSAGRYDEAAKVFEEARKFGRKYGVLPPLARAIAMSAGFHLSVFDFEGAEALQQEARELAQSLGFAPTLVSASIDLLLTFARRHEPGRAEKLLSETAAAAAATPGWHEWLWQLRLSQARAELALARGEFEMSIDEASQGIDQSRARGRPKYEALGLVTRAHALRGLGRTRDAIEDARRAVDVARGTEDPALLLQALDALLAFDGDDALTAEANSLTSRILGELPDDTMRRRFTESEVVQHVLRY